MIAEAEHSHRSTRSISLFRSWIALLRSKPQPFSFTVAALIGSFLGAGEIPGVQTALEAGVMVYLISAAIYLYNDAVEVDLDRMNTQGTVKRPLTTGGASVGEAFALTAFAAAVGLLLAAVLGSLTLLLAASALSLGVAYSAPGIYLKKRFPHKTVVMAVSASLASMMGASPYTIFNMRVAIAVGVTSSYIVTMAIINDFRDIEGDRAFGIRTFPLVLGVPVSLMLMRTGFALTGALIVLSSILYHTAALFMVIALLGLTASIITTLPIASKSPEPKACRKVLKKIRLLHFLMQTALLSLIL